MRHIIVLALLCLVTSLAGAPVAVASAATRPAPGPTLEQGLLDYRAGRFDAAVRELRGFVATTTAPVQLQEAWLTLGRIALQRGDAEEALLYVGQIPPASAGCAARLLQGRALIASGRVAVGAAQLQQLAPFLLTPGERAELLGALAEGQAHSNQSLAAVVLYQQAATLTVEPPQRDVWLGAAHALLRDRLSDAELAEAFFMLAGSAVGADIMLQQAQRALAAGNSESAKLLAEQALATPGDFPYRNDALLLVERLSGKAWLKRSIGVILPLSGRYADFGTQVRRGMELAVAAHNARLVPVEFVFRDGGADAEENARVVSLLANEDRVMAIAGPLTGAAAVAAAQRAQQERVPLLALSQRDGLIETGIYVFRSSLTQHQQVEALVRFAIEVQGLHSFAVLAPEDRTGMEMAELFASEVERRGGQMLGQQSYAENATDFRRQIKLLKGENPNLPDVDDKEKMSAGEKDVKKPAEPPPFQALFIPDDAKRVGMLAPQLVFYGIEGVQLLGTNAWNSPELAQIGGRFVDGAIFVDGFFRNSSAPRVQSFVQRYLDNYQEEPSILAAQGYDAAGILLTLLDRPEVRSREGLRLALSQLRDYPGVTGTTAFNATRDAERVLTLLQVKNGHFEQCN